MEVEIDPPLGQYVPYNHETTISDGDSKLNDESEPDEMPIGQLPIARGLTGYDLVMDTDHPVKSINKKIP